MVAGDRQCLDDGPVGPGVFDPQGLALAPASKGDGSGAHSLLVPEWRVQSAAILEKERLPYVLKPFQFNDF